MAHYDYIIIGAGAAGLMLARAMAEDPWFESKKILLIDQDTKNLNDRTWCYWEAGEGDFDGILTQKWDEIYFRGKEIDSKLPLAPFSYKMLRSSDYYKEQFNKIQLSSNIEFLKARVEKIEEDDGFVAIRTSIKEIRGLHILNSIFDYKQLLEQKEYPVLQQHFIGWFVETKQAVFDPSAATFMDFQLEQKGNTRFMYVLPFSEKKALVEYTLFSSTPLEEKEYELAIEKYLKELYKVSDFTILEKEKGNIPMSCYDFEAQNTKRILHIGTAGGWAKPSTGYTFKNSMRNTGTLISFLKSSESFRNFSVKSRFWYYDLLLLDILAKQNELGSEIFASMFRNRKTSLILKFLNEETNFFQDLLAITGCPLLPFTKALMARVLGTNP